MCRPHRRPHRHLRKDYAARTTSSEEESTEVEGEEEIDMLTNWDDWMALVLSDSDTNKNKKFLERVLFDSQDLSDPFKKLFVCET